VVDLSGHAPWEDLKTLKHELESFKEGLSKKPSMVIGNKAEMSGAQANLAEISSRFRDDVIIPVSAKNRLNIQLATKLMRKMNDQLVERKENGATSDREISSA
jgi:GTP-binding protein